MTASIVSIMQLLLPVYGIGLLDAGKITPPSLRPSVYDCKRKRSFSMHGSHTHKTTFLVAIRPWSQACPLIYSTSFLLSIKSGTAPILLWKSCQNVLLFFYYYTFVLHLSNKYFWIGTAMHSWPFYSIFVHEKEQGWNIPCSPQITYSVRQTGIHRTRFRSCFPRFS